MIHLRTFFAGALFTILVVVAASLAAKAPATHGIGTAALSSAKPLPAPSGPSDHDRLLAVIKRVDQLQNRESVDRQNVNFLGGLVTENADELARTETGLQDLASCVIGGRYLTLSSDTGVLTNSDGTEKDIFIVPTLDPACVEASS